MAATDRPEHTFILQVRTSTGEVPEKWEIERSLDLFTHKYNIPTYWVLDTQEIAREGATNIFIKLPPGNRKFKAVEKVEFPRLRRTTHAA